MTLGQTSSGKDLKGRCVALGAVMVCGLLVISARLYRLQITQGEEYAAKSVANFVKEIRVPADRGMVVDRRGEVLVDNRPSSDLFITPAFCEKCVDEVLPRLASYLSWDEAEAARVAALVRAGRRSAPFRPVAVEVDLDRDDPDRRPQQDTINAHRLDLPGVEVRSVHHRAYKQGVHLAHVLGYMSEITEEELDRLNAAGSDYPLGGYIGRRGIERYFERRLRGKDGLRKEVVNARGEPWVGDGRDGTAHLLGDDGVVPSEPGNNVVLSIDMRLQREAERIFTGTAGSVVVLDVRTGFVLAILSRPAFDPNTLTGRVSAAQMGALTKDPLQPMVFRATAQHYSPGSTFKVVTALAALQQGIYTEHTAVNCPGGYRLGKRRWRCWNDGGHGVKDAIGAMQHSCDTYYYRAADLMGLDPIAEVGKALGLGQPTGIGVVAEVPGIMPTEGYHERLSPGGYTKGFALNAAIGQGDDNVTPLQLTVLYAAIANGGKVYQPQLVRRIETVDGKLLEEFQPKVAREVHISAEHHRLLVESLSAVVNKPGGTAFRTRLKDVEVAGKTGTAQVARIGAVRLKKEQMDFFQRDHAWFASFAPAQSPEIAVVVLNEHGGHGGADAAPFATAIIQKYFDLKREDGQAPPPAVHPEARSPEPPEPPGRAAQEHEVEGEAPTEASGAPVAPAVVIPAGMEGAPGPGQGAATPATRAASSGLAEVR